MEIQDVQPIFIDATHISCEDKAAQSLLRKIYRSVQKKLENDPEKNVANLSEFEQETLKSINETYNSTKNNRFSQKLIVSELLSEAHAILGYTETWDSEFNELFELIENFMFTGLRYGIFKNHFDQFDEVVAKVLKLDFSEQATLLKNKGSAINLSNIAPNSVNEIIEKLKESTVSSKAVNALTSHLGNTGFVVCDECFNIRFCNNLIETLLEETNSNLLGVNFLDFIPENKDFIKSYKNLDSMKNVPVKLKTGKSKYSFINAYITIPTIDSFHNEIDEIVFLLTHDPISEDDYEFNMTMEAHDKLTPLNQIIGAANLIKSSRKIAETKMLANIIRKKAVVMKDRISSTMLSIAQGIPESIEAISYNEIFTDIFNLIGIPEHGGKIELSYQAAEITKPFYTSKRLFISIFQNLISNSIKYSQSDKKTLVHIEVNDYLNGLLITYKDNGIGIPEEMYYKIFNKGIRVQSSKHIEGTGNGLYLVKKSVELLNGHIQLESKLDVGTKFSIKLPSLS